MQSFLYTHCSVINHAVCLRPRSVISLPLTPATHDPSPIALSHDIRRMSQPVNFSGTRSSNLWSASDPSGTIVPPDDLFLFRSTQSASAGCLNFVFWGLNPSGYASLYQAYPFWYRSKDTCKHDRRSNAYGNKRENVLGQRILLSPIFASLR